MLLLAPMFSAPCAAVMGLWCWTGHMTTWNKAHIFQIPFQLGEAILLTAAEGTSAKVMRATAWHWPYPSPTSKYNTTLHQRSLPTLSSHVWTSWKACSWGVLVQKASLCILYTLLMRMTSPVLMCEPNSGWKATQEGKKTHSTAFWGFTVCWQLHVSQDPRRFHNH